MEKSRVYVALLKPSFFTFLSIRLLFLYCQLDKISFHDSFMGMLN